MRKQEQIIIWPAYFDEGKTREEGRRVPKALSVPSPKMSEIEEVVTKLGLTHELVPGKGYSKMPWSKTGMMLVEKQGSKQQVIKRIAMQLQKAHGDAPQ